MLATVSTSLEGQEAGTRYLVKNHVCGNSDSQKTTACLINTSLALANLHKSRRWFWNGGVGWRHTKYSKHPTNDTPWSQGSSQNVREPIGQAWKLVCGNCKQCVPWGTAPIRHLDRANVLSFSNTYYLVIVYTGFFNVQSACQYLAFSSPVMSESLHRCVCTCVAGYKGALIQKHPQVTTCLCCELLRWP